ncbi:MAG: dipeptide epimerase [Elusimicrobia bacterium]|nr:dipeptide epimerase [Elusimicrobiota bacterium]
MNQPFAVSRGRHDEVANALVAVVTRSGITGWGEAAPAAHLTGESQASALRALREIKTMLLGQNVIFARETAAVMREPFKKNPAARAAVEMALLDAWLQWLRIPAWKFFGGYSNLVVTDVTIPLCPLDEAPRQAGRLWRQGIRTLKVKIGREVEEDIERVRRIHRAAPRAKIIIDANQGYRALEALKVWKELLRLNIHPILFEQPVAAADWDGLCEVGRKGRAPVCADESVPDAASAAAFIRKKPAGAVNIKFMKSGLFEALEIARLCRGAGLDLMIGGMVESDLAMGMAAHAAAGLGWFRFIDLDTPLFFKGRAVRPALLKSNGVYDLSIVTRGAGVRPVPAAMV